MNTLRAAQELAQAGLPKDQAEAIARVINDHGRAEAELVTKEYLDSRLWQHTVMIVGSSIAVAGLFKLFA